MTINILAIEDDPVIGRLYIEMLTRENYSVEVLKSGTQALSALEKSAYNLIIMDLSLPDILGADLITKVREKMPSVPVIALSGVCDADIESEVCSLGANLFLSKPFTRLELLGAIEKLINN